MARETRRGGAGRLGVGKVNCLRVEGKRSGRNSGNDLAERVVGRDLAEEAGGRTRIRGTTNSGLAFEISRE